MGRQHEAVMKRCKVCGNTRYDRPFERSTCPYKAIHKQIEVLLDKRGVA